MKKLIIPILLIILIFLILFASRQNSEPALHQAPSATVNHQPTTLFFAGDIMLSRNVAAEMIKAKDNLLPFKKIADIVKNADISFANFELPFFDKGPYAQQGLVFKADPQAIEGLLFAGFDVLSTANNHAFDQGKKGIEFTLSHLKENGITPIGTGLNCHDGVVLEKNGIKFGFLSYSYTALNDGGKSTDPLVCNWNDSGQTDKDITQLKSKADFIIVAPHMGTEYKRNPDAVNVTLSRAAIDAGADLIIGVHPHWIQTIEQYNGKWIFYSLGNFVFDQMWSQDTREGLTIKITLEKKEIKKIELMPVIIDNFCCPRWADEQEKLAILKKINLTSPILIDND